MSSSGDDSREQRGPDTPSVVDTLDPDSLPDLIQLVRTAIGDAAGAERVATAVNGHLEQLHRDVAEIKDDLAALRKGRATLVTGKLTPRDVLMSPWLLVPAGVTGGVVFALILALKLLGSVGP